MSYNDSLIRRYDNTVDDEYQRMIIHQSSTVSLNALMWTNFVAAAVLAWVFPSPQTKLISLVLFVAPLIGLVVGQLWLRKRIPTPRVNRVTPGEMVGLATVIIAWIGGMAMAESANFAEMAGYLSGALVGALIGLELAIVVLRVIVPKMRERDQKRLDKQFGEDE